MVLVRSQGCIYRLSSEKHPLVILQDEKIEGVVPLLPISGIRLLTY